MINQLNKKRFFALFVLLFVLITLPLTLYLVHQRQIVPKKAIQEPVAPEEVTIELGKTETVFDWSNDKCEGEDIPDSPARAFVDADGNVQLIATHYTSRRKIGANLDQVEHQCQKIFTSDKDPDPRKYNDYEWLVSPYTLDGRNIYALIHTEYEGWRHNNCNSADIMNCWWNSINLATSSDKGRTYSHLSPPAHNIANSPVDYNPNNTLGPIGFFEPSNIIFKNGYYYALMTQHNPPGGWGTCLMRNNLSDPKSWRSWDGSGFTLKGYEGPHPRCQILPGNPPHFQVSYNIYLGKYIALDCWDWESGIVYYSFSDDLIHWSERKTLAEKMGPYTSLLQPGDPTGNFEQTGRSPWLYYVISHRGLDRDLKRVRIRFSKSGDENHYELLDLKMNEKKGGLALDSSFYGNNGSLEGSVSWQYSGDRNFLHFDGGRVIVPHKEELTLKDKMTIEAWIRVDPLSLGGEYFH